MKKKIVYFFGAILLLFVVTNPGETSFRNYLDEQEFKDEGRKVNYVVCSIYSADFITANEGYIRQRYFAILGRFYKLE
ncbi:hypothetical protein [Mucilaginibacter sp.]|uniref:hypothetical protein n=1 Tax=Mucilaginibacter sp. TaxID=1882438 RepID=UPI00326682CF